MGKVAGWACLSGAALASALLGACSGGGQGGGLASSNLFFLDSVSIVDGQVWQINRPITFRFSKAVDFSTVTPNTIQIAQPNGAPAIGEFQSVPSDPATVVFVPRCPTKVDLSDAGLQPNGATYRVRVSDATTGAGSVRAITGQGVQTAQTVIFTTPPSLDPLDLFIDTVPGPATPIQGFTDESGEVKGTRLVFDDGSAPLPFVLNEEGNGTLGEFILPLNLYSSLASRTSVILELNQPVNPTSTNINPLRVQYQYNESGEWLTVTTVVELIANCTASGSAVKLTPVGVLPQNRELRIWLGPEFEDLIGDRNVLPLTQFATMQSEAFRDAAGDPVDYADELLEMFVTGGPESLEDTTAVGANPAADWGDGTLAAAFAFTGTGGPGGTFDWHISANTTVVLNTTSSTIVGGPGGFPEMSQLVINGLVNVRDLLVPSDATLRIEGPNPATFLISGSLRVEGLIDVSGADAPPIFTQNQANIPALGGAGNGGGGDGGVGSFLTNQVTSRGGGGSGAFQQGDGGEGGESGWNPSTGSLDDRRAAGGGGGSFGPDELIFISAINDFCYDQSLIGLNAESGFPGALLANAAERQGMQMPFGGMQGVLPFDPLATGDEFWGTLIVDFAGETPTQIQGELPTPWAGQGGGAGGDATLAAAYPPSQLILSDNNRGGGGGGGGGSLTVLCLGDVVFGPLGRIQANGGHGVGGESTSATARIGGGSGGGSGGHIIIQTGSQIDFSLLPEDQIAILARGGQGGVGVGDAGGANTTETGPSMDATHVGVTGAGDMADNPWIPFGPPNCPTAVGVVRGAGGDGGPGIVQLHVGDLAADILYAQSGGPDEIIGSVAPLPVGYDREDMDWVDQLVPLFGRFSQGQSKWVPLGNVAVNPDGPELDPIQFLFDGTDPADGAILATNGIVTELDPILAPENPVEGAGLPMISASDPRTVMVADTAFSAEDQIYARNPDLLERFILRIGDETFSVESASTDEAGTTLLLTVSSMGPELPTSGLLVLVPRFFRVITGGMQDALPESSRVEVSFQAAFAKDGQPDPDNIFPGPDTWATDISEINSVEESPLFRFYRFRVEFEIGIGESDLSFSTPRPGLEFLRTPFRF